MNGRSPAFLVALVVLGLLFPAVVGPGVFRASGGGTAAAAPAKTAEEKGEGGEDKSAPDPGASTCSAGEVPVVGSCTDAFMDTLRDFLAANATGTSTGGGAAPANPTARPNGSACRALPQLPDVSYLVMTVADPVASGLRSSYDAAIDSVVSAVEQAPGSSYQRDRFWLPWGSSVAGGSGGLRGETCAKQLPGLLLFRAPAASPPLVVLVVGETPTWGIHRAAFERALDIAAGSSETHVSVLGPTFS